MYHVGDSIGVSTKATLGRLSLEGDCLVIRGEAEISIRLQSIRSVGLFRLHGTGRMLKIEHTDGILFVSVIRFSLFGYFALVNSVATGNLLGELRSAMPSQPTANEDPSQSLPQLEASTGWSTNNLAFLFGFYALAMLWGIRNIYQTQPSGLDLLVPFGLAIWLGMWSVIDARRRGYRIPMSVQPWFFLLAGVVVPGYVVWSRGWRGVGWMILHACAWLLLATIAMNIGGMIVFGDEWLRAMDQ
jgi:hypothetical protein